MTSRSSWTRGFTQAFVGQKSDPHAQPADVLLTFFLWFDLVILSGVGNVTNLNIADLSIFVGGGIAGLTVFGVLAAMLGRRGVNLNLLVFFCYAMLVILPAVSVSLSPSKRVILLDLYFVLLIATPAFLHLWSWKLQALAGLLSLAAVCILWLPVGSWIALHSIILIALTSLISTLVVVIRSREAAQEAKQLERKGLTYLAEASRHRLPNYVWNVILLQAGLLLVLVFLDVALWGDELSQPLLSKVYGLIVLVFGSLLIFIARPAQLALPPRACT